jgi:ribonuclease I
MYLCYECKERERSWSYVGSSGHCENTRCENYFQPNEDIFNIIAIPIALVIGSKNYKKLTQQKINKYFRKID